MIARARRLVPRAKLWLEVEGEYGFGLGIARILEAIDRTGTMKDAADEVGKSYRHVWSRVKEAEETLGLSLVETRVGGADRKRSELTDRARELVTEFLRLRDDVFRFVEAEFGARIDADLG